MKKLNFAGGEPFLYPKFLHELLRYGKQELKLESMSIVSNGSKITEKFLCENAEFIDILAISCDSFNPETNIKIGRGTTGQNVEHMLRIADWCREYGIKFKINTVVCHLNWDEDMTPLIKQAQPFRWKVFQYVLASDTSSAFSFPNDFDNVHSNISIDVLLWPAKMIMHSASVTQEPFS